MNKYSVERKDMYSISKKTNQRRREMQVSYSSCWKLCKNILGNLSYSKFIYAVRTINKNNSNLYSKCDPNRSQLVCELCFCFNAIILAAGLDEKHFKDFLDSKFKNWSTHEIYSILAWFLSFKLFFKFF